MTSSMTARSSPLVLGMEMRRLASATISSLLTRSAGDAPVIDLPDPLIRTGERRAAGAAAHGYCRSRLTRDVRTERRR